MSHKKSHQTTNTASIEKIFNFVGGALICFGILYFVHTNWDDLSTTAKIGITLGGALTTYAIAVLLSRINTHSAIGGAFFMISGLILPIGISITTDNAHLATNILMNEVMTSGICLLLFAGANFYFQRDILRLFCVVFASIFFFTFITYLCESFLPQSHHVTEYIFLILGFSYLIVGAQLDTNRITLAGPLYFFGSLFVLSSSFDLAGFLFFDAAKPFWKMLAPLFVLESFLLAVPLRSKSLLYIGAIFLVIYLINITQLFPDIFGKLGWPLIFISAGFLLMLLGYLIVHIHRKITDAYYP